VSFEQASGMFTSGVDFLEIYDDVHSVEEERFIAIGPISEGIVLVVFTEVVDETLRIVSARMATSLERSLYYAHMEAT
jgi:uncharacterized DUF497 family protein